MNASQPLLEDVGSITKQSARQALLSQIQVYREKISHYQQIQHQINQISIVINEPKSVETQKQKQLKGKVGIQTQKKQYPSIRRSTNKKIKVYDLQKKLSKLTNEFNEKKNNYQQSRLGCQKLQRLIQNEGYKIQEQKKTNKNLTQLEHKICGDVALAEQKVLSQLDSLEESVKNKEMFNFQRRKLRDQMRRLRSLITKIVSISPSNQQLSLSLSNEQQKQILNNSGNEMADCQSSMWINRQRQRFDELFNKLDLYQQKNNEMIDLFYELKKDFSDNQIITKHHKLTIALQSSQLKMYENIIQQIKYNIIKTNEEADLLSTQLRKIQGERGYLRGKIGVVIEQQRLIKGVNSLSQRDIKNLSQKFQQLKMLRYFFNEQNRNGQM